jgi:dihydrofolate reductase
MGKLHVSTLVTLDGVVQDPGGFGETDDGGWAGPYFDEETGRRSYERLLASETFLMGRVTYEIFKSYWPQVHEGDYSARINDMPKLVASTTMQGPLEWNAQLIEGDVVEAIAQRKQEDPGDIVMYGSPNLMRTLADHDLIDEYQLLVAPIVLGSGTRLFAGGFDKTSLRLVDTTTMSTGLVALTYVPARA